MTFGKRASRVLDPFRTVLVVFLAVAVLLFVHSNASVFWAIAAAAGKLLLLAVTAVVGWASWTGYFQNRGENGEWPFNILFFVLSAAGAVALVASMVR
ncbi:MAG: hypothetical protein GX458_04870 [Phyllobacteriaceae bacterium]|nr:hypothetical protein [Phyllobacteriaceae bacterium]